MNPYLKNVIYYLIVLIVAIIIRSNENDYIAQLKQFWSILNIWFIIKMYYKLQLDDIDRIDRIQRIENRIWLVLKWLLLFTMNSTKLRGCNIWYHRYSISLIWMRTLCNCSSWIQVAPLFIVKYRIGSIDRLANLQLSCRCHCHAGWCMMFSCDWLTAFCSTFLI